jgi:Domain of unknown function (DUF6851)/VCPO second helical-bundle domain
MPLNSGSPAECGTPVTPRLVKEAAMSGTAIIAWNQAALEAVRRTRLGPPMAARAIHILHTAMYDAWAAYDHLAVGTRLGDVWRRPPAQRGEDAKREAVSFAAYHALVDLFPAQRALFVAVMDQLGYDPGVLGGEESPSAVGTFAARAVLALRHGDGSNQLGDLAPGPYADWTGYRPVNPPDRLVHPNRWQPLRQPDGTVQRFLAPHWGLVAPFALRVGSQLRPRRGPRRLPGAGYLRQAEQVLRDSAELTDQHKVITEYWADGPGTETPPGHWCRIAQWVSARDCHGLDQNVVLFFALGAALHDAGVAAWDAKRAFGSVRPVSAIRWLFADDKVCAWGGPGQGTTLIKGEAWQPYLPTPPFAEYVSGHSTFSAAAAEVLAHHTGSDRFGASAMVPAGSSQVEPGITPAAAVTLHWPTFTDAADQAGLSRRYGGIHFRDGDLAGRALGRMVGLRAWLAASALVGMGARARSGVAA